jgi:hypothetical protein
VKDKDQRYKAVKSMIQTKSLHSLQSVFDIIPLSIVQKDMGVNYTTLHRRVYSIELLTVGDILKMAKLFEVEPIAIFNLVGFDIVNRKK